MPEEMYEAYTHDRAMLAGLLIFLGPLTDEILNSDLSFSRFEGTFLGCISKSLEIGPSQASRA
jgi:hypothetical protein